MGPEPISSPKGSRHQEEAGEAAHVGGAELEEAGALSSRTGEPKEKFSSFKVSNLNPSQLLVIW